MQNKKTKSALKVQKGITAPDSINPLAKESKKRSSTRYKASYYIKGILSGERAVLSQAITLTESTLLRDQQLAQKIIEACLPYAGNSFRIGITGVPGVGKSTFIEALGFLLVTKYNKKLAVLAIDPSSARSKGSILGDKTRMEKLATNNNAFIRPSPSAGSLGGVAQKTRESIILCEAAGYDLIFVETVGVGQSETAVHAMVDFFLLLMLAGAGDELQGIKRGIMEMADALIINKADGDNYQKALLAKTQYANALHLFPRPPSHWRPETALCSSLKPSGLEEIWKMILDYEQQTKENGYFTLKRKEQNIQTLNTSLEDKLRQRFSSDKAMQEKSKFLEKQVAAQKISPYQAAEQLLQFFIEKLKTE
ncbi:MAG: methylmalonyl Co-A mutase-associated GTPase MeaB [Bacteroidales bacterium]|nr:methylmalonyl Co-A mutase-associated GTPase MeaB [Bacteroidales bacterium]